MKNSQKGFIGLPILIAIVVGIVVLGGGTYFFIQQQSSSQVSPTSNSQPQQQLNQPTTSGTPSSVSQTDTSNMKTYRNEKYGYSFNYPKSYFAFEWPGQYRGEKPYLVVAAGNKDSMEITPVDLLNTDDALGSSWLRVNRENGTAWISGSKIVDDFWSKLSKTDDKGNEVNVFVKKQSIHGIDFIIFNQKNWDISSQSYLWSLQALFMYKGNFFWVSSSPQMDKDTFYSILNSFTVSPTASVLPTTQQNNTSQATTKIICSLSGNTIDDGSNQNGLTFFAQGQSCATLSGWAPNNPTSQNLTFNGVTKTWRMVLLSFYNAHFSPDGNHFAYTASNIPLPQVSAGGDWKPQRFVVSDNVAGATYDDVYYPQYSQDGKHLGYCAYQDGQYMKIIDGVKTVMTKDDYFATCDSLFGFKQSPPADHSQESQGEKSPDGSYTIRQTECSAKFGCKAIVVMNNTSGVSKEYPEGGERSRNASNVIFSPDSKHFAWLMGSQVYVDGNWNGKKYDEAFNLNFSSDSKSVTYNARSAKTVYFVTNPIN